MFHLTSHTDRISIQVKCPECGSHETFIDNQTGERICQQCAIVISSRLISTEPEWRAFDVEQRESLPRTGAPLTLMIHDNGLSTTIGWKNRDALGREISQEARARLIRLRKWQQRSKVSDGYNRNLTTALNALRNYESKLHLPRNVAETSSHIYRNALRTNFVRGRTIKSVAAACIYIACRQCQVIRSLNDVATVSGLSRKEVARNYRLLVRQLNPSIPQVDPSTHIGKIMGKLGLFGETEKLANMLLTQLTTMKMTVGRGPAGMAAACVYISARILDLDVTQSDIAAAGQITEVTLRNRYKEALKILDLKIQV